MTKVCIELKNGKKMNVELYEDVAPITVKNFLKLVDEKFYDGLIFHRIIKDFMCQGGGFFINNQGKVEQKETDSIVGEFASNGHPNPLKHDEGVISMARTMVLNSATSQFFLCNDNCQHLNGQYAGFGKICDEDSLKVLRELNHLPTKNYIMADWPNAPIEDYTIQSIYRI